VAYWETVHVATSDFVTILLLVALEGLLSADNALVMAIIVLGLPRHERHKALRYGLVGAFAMRVVATLAAVYLIRLAFVKLLGGLYLAYLVFTHFTGHTDEADRRSPPRARPWLGMTAFWATVVRVELVNLAFSIDSILVAVAMSPKLWVVIAGGVLGIVAMRVVVGQLLALIQHYPALVDGAFVIIAWVAVKLVIEFLHQMGYIRWAIPQWLSLGLIVAIFLASYVIARRHPAHVDPGDARVAEVLK
jgi:YkoY family integral membrane protein